MSYTVSVDQENLWGITVVSVAGATGPQGPPGPPGPSGAAPLTAQMHRVAALTIGTGLAPVPFDTTIHDVHGLYNAASSNFAIATAGWWGINVGLTVLPTAAGQWFSLKVDTSNATRQIYVHSSVAAPLSAVVAFRAYILASAVININAVASVALPIFTTVQNWADISYLGTGP